MVSIASSTIRVNYLVAALNAETTRKLIEQQNNFMRLMQLLVPEVLT